MQRVVVRSAVSAATMLAMAAAVASARAQSIIVQSTTSTANSGLYRVLLPRLKQDTGVTAHVVAVGTGQALRNGRNCDGDVVLVHAKVAEEAFVARGFGIKRYDVMYNDFIIVGPDHDPAGVGRVQLARQALVRIAQTGSVFVSRGDNSGTHKKELALWAKAGQDPRPASGTWYRETGSGMGAALNISAGMGAYTLADRGTWLSFKNKGRLKVWLEGDVALFNQYGVIQVSHVKCPNVKADAARQFVRWVLSKPGQSVIAAFRVDGQQLFFPNATDRPR